MWGLEKQVAKEFDIYRRIKQTNKQTEKPNKKQTLIQSGPHRPVLGLLQ